MKELREKLAEAIWACSFAPHEDPAVIEAKKADWPDDLRAAERRADAALSVIAAYTEDEAVVERVADAIAAQRWTTEETVAKSLARAALSALKGEVKP